jgi:hypothetical protein
MAVAGERFDRRGGAKAARVPTIVKVVIRRCTRCNYQAVRERLHGTFFFLSAGPSGIPAFEAASVKPTDPRRTGSTFNFAPGQLQIGGGTLRQIMEMAYGVPTFQILGGPA